MKIKNVKLFIAGITLLSIGLSSCRDRETQQVIGCHEVLYRNCVCQYVVSPTFRARIIDYSPTTQDHSKVTSFIEVYVDESEGLSTNILSATREEDKEDFLKYAKRYKDTTFNRRSIAPRHAWALGEPFTKIKCYELSSKEEMIEVTDKFIFRALTFLPYIKSGYNDELVPKYDSSLFRYPIYKERYLVNKPLVDLREDDMTLLDTNSWGFVFELEPIRPYQLSKNSKLKIVLEYAGNTQRIIAS